MKKAVFVSIILMGFTAMASQIVYMREFLTVFYGNELSIGFILASWLVGGAIGSSVLGRLADRIRFKIASFALCQILLSMLLPIGVLAIRSTRIILKINVGEIIPIFSMIVSSLAVLTPVCIILGFMFSLACRIYEFESHIGAAKIGKVYLLESVGAAIGGCLASCILIRLLNSFQIIGIFSLLNILAALFLLSSSKERKGKSPVVAITAIIFIAAVLAWPFKVWNGLNEYSLKREWQGHELVASKNSIYGNIAVVKESDQTSFFDNGLHLYTVPDEQASEEAVHFALLEHPSPSDVLLIGGGVGGLAGEILKHPIRRLDYVELDPLVVKMAEDYLPQKYYQPLRDARVSIKNEDGRLFIKNTNEKYDCIIIDLGDPYTAQLNRYYTAEFFKEANRILKKGGIISFGLTSSESYINRELGNFLKSIYATLNEVFEDIKIIPGETAYFLASNEKKALTYDYNVLVERIRERRLDIKYVREYYLFSKLSQGKISYIENAVKSKNGVRVNRDFRPASYYYNIIFWTARFRDSLFNKVLKAVTEETIWKFTFSIYALTLLLSLIRMKDKRLHRKAVLVAVTAAGFSAITFQVVILLAFQIIYGYMFYKLGFILTFFMVGLAFGSWCTVKIMPKIKNDLRLFILTQGSVALYPLALPIFFWWLSISRNPVVSWAGSNILFSFLPIIAGFIGGFQFPLANKIYLEKSEDIGKVSGLSYGLDLLGSCAGAILTGAFLIPILGIPKTCLAAAGINFTVLILLVLSSRSHRTA